MLILAVLAFLIGFVGVLTVGGTESVRGMAIQLAFLLLAGCVGYYFFKELRSAFEVLTYFLVYVLGHYAAWSWILRSRRSFT